MMICCSLLTLAMLLTFDEPDVNWPDFSLECVQNELCIGDSLYAVVHAHNPHEDSFYLSDGAPPVIKVKLLEPEVHFVDEIFLPIEFDPWPSLSEIKSLETKVTTVISISVPPLEDLHTPGWEEFVKDFPMEGKKLTLEYTINACVAKDSSGREGKRQIIKLTHEFTVKQRRPEEMALIEKWYREMPNSFFPGVVKDRQGIPKQKIWIWGWPKNEAFDEPTSENERKKLIVAFHRTGNRYPTYPNAPVTWQGWKELEESLEPSTMRDEIRMTRICIQYLQTKDDSVFEELKEWFSDMAEPQRTVMTKDVLTRATKSYGTGLLTPLGHVYRAIGEYYVPRGESDLKFLRGVRVLDGKE